ncbi:YesL family protein [Gracilibacillus saliphilus]|uniref:YesL family protein n=1 Tax=Gracilibacillus saliphilus TaxID=543890 RepID=UPI0013D15125|nr:DUF624 domain-containing protein [Gracilibacillus saliphilus]
MIAINGFFKYLYIFGHWLGKVMVLHIYWLVSTLLGMGLFGFAPATIALTSVIYKWFTVDPDISITKEFWQVYKKNFVKANIVFLGWACIGLFLYMDYFVSKTYIQNFYFHAILLVLISVCVTSFSYFLIVFVRYELSIVQYFRQAFLIALARPLEAVAILLSLLILYYLYMSLPVLTAFVGVPLTLYPILWFSYRACLAVEENKEKIEQKSKTPSYERS